MDHSIRHDQQCIQSDRAARRLESGKITAGSNFDSTCCCAEAATADFVFFPQILPSDNPLKLKQLKSLRAHNFRFMLSKRLRKRFDMLVSFRCRRDPAWDRTLRTGLRASDAPAH